MRGMARGSVWLVLGLGVAFLDTVEGQCAVGYGGSPCTACTPGTYSPGGTGATCLSCPLNSYSVSGSSTCFAAAGYYDLGASMTAYYPFNSGDLLKDVKAGLGALTTPGAGVGTAPTASSTSSSGLSNSASFAGGGSSSTTANYYIVPSVTLGHSFTFCMWYLIDSSVSRGWMRLWDFGQGAASYNFHYGMYGVSTNDAYNEHFATTKIQSNQITDHFKDTNTWYHVCNAWEQAATGTAVGTATSGIH